MTPTEVTARNTNEVTHVATNTSNGSSVNPTTTTGHSSHTPVNSGPWVIHGIPIFLNKLSPSVSLLKEELVHVPVWVKFHDVPLVAYPSDGLSLVATKLGTPMMLDSYTNSIRLESWGRSTYARILIEIIACNDFSDNLVMVVPNIGETRYMKEPIRVEYEWKPPRCSKGQIPRADDEGFIEVKRKKSGGNYGGNKHIKSVSVKPKTQYEPKAKQSTAGTCNSPKIVPLADTNKASEVTTGSKVTTTGMQEEEQCYVPLVEMINVLEKQICN
ncbi:zinc knuckle CX2CX4HX4C containing protein [Tanacetum coccineum]